MLKSNKRKQSELATPGVEEQTSLSSSGKSSDSRRRSARLEAKKRKKGEVGEKQNPNSLEITKPETAQRTAPQLIQVQQHQLRNILPQFTPPQPPPALMPVQRQQLTRRHLEMLKNLLEKAPEKVIAFLQQEQDNDHLRENSIPVAKDPRQQNQAEELKLLKAELKNIKDQLAVFQGFTLTPMAGGSSLCPFEYSPPNYYLQSGSSAQYGNYGFPYGPYFSTTPNSPGWPPVGSSSYVSPYYASTHGGWSPHIPPSNTPPRYQPQVAQPQTMYGTDLAGELRQLAPEEQQLGLSYAARQQQPPQASSHYAGSMFPCSTTTTSRTTTATLTLRPATTPRPSSAETPSFSPSPTGSN